MNKCLIIFVIVLVGGFPAVSQTARTEDSIPLVNIAAGPQADDFSDDVIGETSIEFRDLAFNPDTLKAWRNKKEYRWLSEIDSAVQNRRNSAPQRMTGKADENVKPRREVDSPVSTHIGGGGFVILAWIVAAGLIIFALFKLFAAKGLFSGRTAVLRDRADAPEEEEIQGTDFTARVKKAKESGDFRYATRWLFLMTLQRLEQKGIIRFSPDKTNSTYVSEMPEGYRAGFAQLALYYDYIWYGNAVITQNTFSALEAKFSSFLNRMP